MGRKRPNSAVMSQTKTDRKRKRSRNIGPVVWEEKYACPPVRKRTTGGFALSPAADPHAYWHGTPPTEAQRWRVSIYPRAACRSPY
jgi:hypothetical protein